VKHDEKHYKASVSFSAMELVAFLGKDKESWSQVNALAKRGEWDRVVLVRNKESEPFPKPANGVVVDVDCEKTLVDLKDEIRSKLKETLANDFEVALSIASGSGKEHMALISALLTVPVGIRLVAFTKKGVEFIN
tara:strand:+ start:785 stop:1189 length:405 start_codon:yes stop_codon:yes gene_type:complete